MFKPQGYSGPIPLEIGRIDTKPASEVRAATDADRVAEYSETLTALPPLLVVADENDHHWMADGYHRYKAHLGVGKGVVPCLVKRGTYLDAYRDACHANDAHGLPTTNADKRRRVEKALTHPEMSKWSQGAIAEACGVSQQYVSKLDQRSTHNNGELKTTGKDGKERPKPKPRQPRNEAFACTTCGEEFSSVVWHCHQCGGHWGGDHNTCPTCVTAPEPLADDGLGGDAKDEINEAFPPSRPAVFPRFDVTGEFDAVDDYLRSEMERWPKEYRPMFAMRVRALGDSLCTQFGVTIEEINRGA